MTNKLSNLSRQEETALILKELANNGSFAEYCIAIDRGYQLEWFHEEVARKLEQGYKRLLAGEDVRIMFFMPPRHGKSDMTTQKFTSWVLGKTADIPIMVSSYSDELATDFGQRTRDIMQSPEYQVMFNTRLRPDAKAKGKWLTQNGGSYTAVGVGGALTGRGFKIGIIDDPFKNREEAGELLAQELAAYRNDPAAILLALPRGGVAVAYQLSLALHLPLDVLITRKIGAPGNPE